MTRICLSKKGVNVKNKIVQVTRHAREYFLPIIAVGKKMRAKLLIISLFISITAIAQQGRWQVQLHREDGNDIVFSFDWKIEKGKPVWYILNATEKIRVPDISFKADSVIVNMPVFESQFLLQYKNNELKGVWIRSITTGKQIMPFLAYPGNDRFGSAGKVSHTISGRWAATFINNKTAKRSVAEFIQKGHQLTGTFLTTTGDYRFLEGVIRNDSLFLSTFDGAHAYLFTAKIAGDKDIVGGMYYSGPTSRQEWTAVKDANATVPSDPSAMYLKEGEERLDFTFKDLEGKAVSINDERFKNKVVVVQLMGSWCPNCLDETAFLSDYYNKNRKRGVEIISLAYEYSSDFERSRKSLKKFQQRFNVQYPMLITGVMVSDTLRTEKTLPQLTPIKFFPSSVILDKKGKVRKLDTSFNG
ncbi:MAG: TlpA disulfide reductase family protein, partial [Chitinophagaceae bacterium]